LAGFYRAKATIIRQLLYEVLYYSSMATVRKTRFSRRVPDHVTDELVNVLSDGKVYEFNVLFGLVYDNLKLKNAVSGGEEMLRLRSYEKLQNLVSRGLVEKKLKSYRGLKGIEQASSVHTLARAEAAAAAAAAAR
jgi:hypothetical protein